MKKLLVIALLLAGFVKCQPVFGVISSTDGVERFPANGSSTTFNFTFRLTDQTEMVAIVRADSTGVDTDLDLNVDYTLSATNNDFSNGGTLTTTETYASGNTLILHREVLRTQTVNLIQGMAMPAERTETTLDKQTMAIQDIDKNLGFYISVPKGDPTTALNLVLPSSVDRADRNLTFDSTGSVQATVSLNEVAVSAFGETLVDDTSALVARGTLGLDTDDNVEFAAIAGTTGTFSAAVSGTTGTFTGALIATTGTFSDLVTANNGVTLGAGDDLIGSSTSGITFNTNKFTVAGATGDTAIAGTLGVTGASTFTAGITANGGVTLGAGDDLIGSSTSDITINTNKFTVAGASGDTVIAGTASVGGTLDVTGNIDPTSYETTNGGFIDDDAMGATATDTVVASAESIKAYVDAQAGISFSAYTNQDSESQALALAHAYLATSDGFVSSQSTQNTEGRMIAYVDTDNNPASGGKIVGSNETDGTADCSVFFAVASGEYFEITLSNGTATIYWKSMGTLSKPVDQD